MFDPDNEWVAIHYNYGQDINARQVALVALKKGESNEGIDRLRKQLLDEINELTVSRHTAKIMLDQRVKLLSRDKGN